jgi:hypothetical protein
VCLQKQAGEDGLAWRAEQPDTVMGSDPVMAGRC